MAHRLEGAVEKFNRAKQHFDELRAELDSFFNAEPQPYASVGEFDTDAWEWIERFQIREEPPLRLGVILGDCLHNLRSALDHLIWQVTMLDGGATSKDTQFPIASESEAQFDEMSKRRIPGLSETHRALIKRLQPYHAGDLANAHPLAVLAKLSNTDKHRIVNPTYSFVNADAGATLGRLIANYQGPEQSPVKAFWMARAGSRLEHGTPWFRIEFRRGEQAPREVKMGGHVTFGIAFGEIGLDAADYSKIADAVRAITEAFLADFPETEYIEAS